MKTAFEKLKDVRVSVVIPSYHSKRYIKDLIDSILENYAGIVDEIIIIDNSEMEFVITKSDIDLSIVRTYCTGKNLGFRIAVNIGVSKCSNEIVLISNPDIVVNAESMMHCVSTLVNENEVACTFPLIVQRKDRINNYHTKISIPFLASFAEFDLKTMPRESNIYVQRFSGAFFFIKKSVFNAIGGFVNESLMYFEEDELSVKLLNNGYKICFCPKDSVFHFGGHAIQEKNKLFFLAVDSLRTSSFLYKHYSSDGIIRRFVWWNLFLLESIQYSVFLLDLRPLEIGLSEYISLRSDIPNEGSNNHLKLYDFWDLRYYFLEKVRLLRSVIKNKKDN